MREARPTPEAEPAALSLESTGGGPRVEVPVVPSELPASVVVRRIDRRSAISCASAATCSAGPRSTSSTG